LHAPDAWIWAYVVFAVSNTMLPSRADVHAWPFLAAALIIAAVIAVIAGAGAILLQGLSQFLTHAARWIILLGGSTLLIDLPFFLFIFLVERGLIRLTGREIVYE
jgi:hypothetical protein